MKNVIEMISSFKNRDNILLIGEDKTEQTLFIQSIISKNFNKKVYILDLFREIENEFDVFNNVYVYKNVVSFNKIMKNLENCVVIINGILETFYEIEDLEINRNNLIIVQTNNKMIKDFGFNVNTFVYCKNFSYKFAKVNINFN